MQKCLHLPIPIFYILGTAHFCRLFAGLNQLVVTTKKNMPQPKTTNNVAYEHTIHVKPVGMVTSRCHLLYIRFGALSFLTRLCKRSKRRLHLRFGLHVGHSVVGTMW